MIPLDGWMGSCKTLEYTLKLFHFVNILLFLESFMSEGRLFESFVCVCLCVFGGGGGYMAMFLTNSSSLKSYLNVMLRGWRSAIKKHKH